MTLPTGEWRKWQTRRIQDPVRATGWGFNSPLAHRLTASTRPTYPERVFERFTDRARRVVVLAQAQARLLNHDYIGTEHILLGLIEEGEGIAARALAALDVPFDAVRREIQEMVGEGRSVPTGHIPFTPRAKKVLELSLREALQLGHNYIGTEHILLGLVREGEGVAAQVLQKLGADLDRVRAAVIQQLSARGISPGPVEGREPEGGRSPRCPHCRIELAGSVAIERLEVPDEEGDEPISVAFVFCSRCGTTLGTLL